MRILGYHTLGLCWFGWGLGVFWYGLGDIRCQGCLARLDLDRVDASLFGPGGNVRRTEMFEVLHDTWIITAKRRRVSLAAAAAATEQEGGLGVTFRHLGQRRLA